MRGDMSHLREQSRFQLEIEKDARTALALALRNWETQREPADLRVLAAAAGANSDKAALAVVSDWLAATRLEDLAVAALMAGKAR
jgi:hypothetical protein